MFDRHQQKAVLLFAVADVILTILAFEAAYQTRQVLPLANIFYITTPTKALLLGFILVLWLVLGSWIGTYTRLYGADLRAAAEAEQGWNCRCRDRPAGRLRFLGATLYVPRLAVRQAPRARR